MGIIIINNHHGDGTLDNWIKEHDKDTTQKRAREISLRTLLNAP